MENEPALQTWTAALERWTEFYDMYFHNEYEWVISTTRDAPGVQTGLSNRTRVFFIRSYNAATSDDPHQLQRWLKYYGCLFSDCHYFNEECAFENLQIRGLYLSEDRPLLPPKRKRAIRTRVADLATDDNLYKHFLNYSLRQLILSIAKVFLPSDPLRIWDLSLSQIDTMLTTKALPENFHCSPLVNNVEKEQQVLIQSQSFASVPLTGGSVEGRACLSGEAPTGDSILVRRTLVDSDFPALLVAKGAVVALGSATSHGVLLASELGKTVHLSREAYINARSGAKITLDEAQRRVALSPE
jgi:hypothetical protein